jgi:hypothetical protein
MILNAAISVLSLVAAIFALLVARANLRQQLARTAQETWLREFREQVALFLAGQEARLGSTDGIALRQNLKSARPRSLRSTTGCGLPITRSACCLHRRGSSPTWVRIRIHISSHPSTVLSRATMAVWVPWPAQRRSS